MLIGIALRSGEGKISGRVEEPSLEIRSPLRLWILFRLTARAVRLQIDRTQRARFLVRHQRPANILSPKCRDVLVARVLNRLQNVFACYIRTGRYLQRTFELDAVGGIGRPRSHLAQISHLLGNQRDRTAALRHICNRSPVRRMLFEYSGHHSVDLHSSQQHPTRDALTVHKLGLNARMTPGGSSPIDRASPSVARPAPPALPVGRSCIRSRSGPAGNCRTGAALRIYPQPARRCLLLLRLITALENLDDPNRISPICAAALQPLERP